MMGVILKKKKKNPTGWLQIFIYARNENVFCRSQWYNNKITKTHNGGSLFLKHKTTINAKSIIDFKSIAFEKMWSLL